MRQVTPRLAQIIISIYSLDTFQIGIIFLQAHPRESYTTTVWSFVNIVNIGGIVIMRNMTDGLGDSYIPHKVLFAGGIIKEWFLTLTMEINVLWKCCVVHSDV